MKFLRSSIQCITVDFCRETYLLNDGKFDSFISFGKVVAKKQVDGGFLVCYQDATNLLFHQEAGDFDGELLDRTFNRVEFYPIKAVDERRVRFFEPKTINAFVYSEDSKYGSLCYFNPGDFDETLKTPIKGQKRRGVGFENVSAVYNVKKPAFFLRGTETETKRGVERVWELWRDNERVECKQIIFTDLFYNNSFGDDWEICNWL